MSPTAFTKTRTLVIVSHKRHHCSSSGVFVRGGFLTITNEIAKHFHQVVLCVPVQNCDSLPVTMHYRPNVELMALPFYNNRYEMAKHLPVILKRLSKATQGADMIYAMCPNDIGAIGLAVARLHRKPLFTSFDTDRANILRTRNYSGWKYSLKYAANKFLLYPYFRVLARRYPSFITGDMFLGSYPDWHQWVKSTHTTADLVRRLEPTTHSNTVTLVFAGRLSPEKNISRLITVLARLRRRGRDVRLKIFGDGSLMQALKKQVESAGLISCVEFKGFRPGPELLKTKFDSADLLVLPSTEERQGKVLLEAMACGIPVAASRIGGIPSVITEGVNGVLFNPHSTEDMEEKLQQMIDDSHLRQDIALGGFDFARRHALDKEVEKIICIVSDYYSRRGEAMRSSTK